MHTRVWLCCKDSWMRAAVRSWHHWLMWHVMWGGSPPIAGNMESLVKLILSWVQALSKRCKNLWLILALAVVSMMDWELLRDRQELKSEDLRSNGSPLIGWGHHKIPPSGWRDTGDCEALSGQMAGSTKQDPDSSPCVYWGHAGHICRHSSVLMFKIVTPLALFQGWGPRVVPCGCAINGSIM